MLVFFIFFLYHFFVVIVFYLKCSKVTIICLNFLAAETGNYQCPASGSLVPSMYFKSNLQSSFLRILDLANSSFTNVFTAGSFSRHPHDEDCRQFYVCLDGIAREYGCPIGTVFQIGLSDGVGECSDPADVPGW